MGGYGSGEHCYRDDKRDTTNDYRRLDSFLFADHVLQIQQRKLSSVTGAIKWSDGCAVGYTAFLDRTVLTYSFEYKAQRKAAKNIIDFDSVPNHYGGHDRIYFLCPHCGRRSRFLYLIMFNFQCRKCAGLNYKSQQVTKNHQMAEWKVISFVRANFGNVTDILSVGAASYIPPRPKGMHRATYERLLAELTALQKEYAEQFIEWRHKARESMIAALEADKRLFNN